MEFLNKLSFEEIRTVLNRCGLFLVDDENVFLNIKTEEQNSALDCYYFRAMDYNPDKNNNKIITSDLIKNRLFRPFTNDDFGEIFLDYSNLNSNVDIYSVSDFMLCRAFPIDICDKFPNKRDLELQEKYVSVMSSTFKSKEYEKEYNKFVDNQLSDKVNESSPENV